MLTWMLPRSRMRMTHDWPLVGRQDADAQVVVLAVEVHLDAPVLRPALLGDVDATHDLDTRRACGASRRRGGLSRSTSTPSMR